MMGLPVRLRSFDDLAHSVRAGRPSIELSDPAAWIRTTVPLKRYAGRRRFRRIDLRVSRVVPPFALGVMTGEVVVR